MASNLLVINPSKTCVMIKPMKPEDQIREVKIGKQDIEVEKDGKLLGLTVSDDLSWALHVSELAKTIGQRVFIIRRLKETLPVTHLIKVGEALINSKIRYGIAVYGSIQLTEEEPKTWPMKRLQVLQNNLMRIVLGKKKSDCVSVRFLLQQTGYLSINQLSTYHTLQEMFCILNTNSVPSIKEEFIKVDNVVHNTRLGEKDLLKLPMAKKKRNGGFIHKGVKIWNALPLVIRQAPSKNRFSEEVKSWITSNIPI